MSEMNEGIARGDIDCMYFDVWRRFSNRPADEEYWRESMHLPRKVSRRLCMQSSVMNIPNF
jgi:hypothetical protein